MSEQRCVYVIHIGAPAERVWAALTEGAFTRRYFFCTDVRSTWQVGDPVTYVMGDRPAVVGRVVAAERPRLLRVTWSPQYDPDMARETPSQVTFDLHEAGGVTRLTMTHDRFPPGSRVHLQVVDGWPEVLSSLKSLLETGQPLAIAGNEPAIA